MDNYFMLDGHKVNMSDETVQNLRDTLKKTPLQCILNKYRNYKLTFTTIQVHKNYIKIPLPHANKEWTFEAWHIAEKIVNELQKIGKNAFPYHTHAEATRTNIIIRFQPED